MSRFLLAALAAMALLPGCEDARARYAASLGTAPPVAPPAHAPRDDWTTFAHDARRSGFQPQPVGLDATTVRALATRWIAHLGEPIKASPLVAGGAVYVAGQRGTVRALDVRSGRVRWTAHLGGDIEMTPTLADDTLFVGVRAMPGVVAALDANTGAVRWRVSFPGGVRGEPIVAGGVVFVPETGGDSPFCGHGGIHAIAVGSGRPLWSWFVAGRPRLGGSVWSPLGFDGAHLIFGTGNACVPGVASANAIVALDLRGKRRWSATVAPSNSDDDFGGGTLLVHGQAIATNKDGSLYEFDAATGSRVWTTPMGSAPGYGGIGTPTTDGATIVASAGFLHDPTRTAGPAGAALMAFDMAGHPRWTVPSKNPVPGAVAVANGLAFTPLDDRFVALDLATGEVRWSYPSGSSAYASPAVVPSGVYFANDAGAIFAFSPRP